MKQQVSWAVMPIHECKHLTRDAVESVLAQEGVSEVRLLCVLDKATDGVGQLLWGYHPRVQTIAMPGVGVSKCWNASLARIFDFWGAPAALVVNSDVRLRPDAYKRLLDDGGLFVTCVGTSSGAKFPGGEPSGQKRPHPDFSCFLIRCECWERVGPFDESMRIYASDQDYHLRMHRAGISAYCLDLPFWHYASGTLKNGTIEDRERILKQAEEDRGRFRSKWGFAGGSDEYYRQFKTGAPE